MKTLYIFLIFIGLLACTTDDDALPENVIESPNGLIITLEWSTGGSATQAQTDADLDLYLVWEDTPIAVSETSTFEQLKIQDYFADGDFIIEVEYFEGAAGVDYSIYLNGDGSNENLVYESSFLSTEKGKVVSYLKIHKAGDAYTVTAL